MAPRIGCGGRALAPPRKAPHSISSRRGRRRASVPRRVLPPTDHRAPPTRAQHEGRQRRRRHIPRAQLRPEAGAAGRGRGRGRGRAVPVGAERVAVAGRRRLPAGAASAGAGGAGGGRGLAAVRHEGLLLAAAGAGAHPAPPPPRLQGGDPAARHRLHLGPAAGAAAPAGPRPAPGRRPRRGAQRRCGGCLRERQDPLPLRPSLGAGRTPSMEEQ